MDNQIGEIDTGARGKPSLSFETSTSTWKNMARIAVLCNSAEFAESAADAGDRGKQRVMEREVVGNPIEAALLRLVEAVEGSSGTFRSMHPLVCEIPYSPIIKFRLSIHECADYQVLSSNVI